MLVCRWIPGFLGTILFFVFFVKFTVHSQNKLHNYTNYPLKFSNFSTFVELNGGITCQACMSGNLLWSHPPGRNVIVGIAMFANFQRGLRRFVGSLRYANFSGHIILGVDHRVSANELDFLKRMDVTVFRVETVACSAQISDGQAPRGIIRGKCSTGLENLKLEWGRFELARQWIRNCTKCTGWMMIVDIRDTFFQGDPFKQLPIPPSHDSRGINLYFIEEIGPHTSPDPDTSRSFVAGNMRSRSHTVPCYGTKTFDIYGHRPVLCSGTVLGTRAGMERFLYVLLDEFYHHNREGGTSSCRSPSTTDQWIMNWLYYNGRFAEPQRTATIPWGTGPVLTAGKACMTKDRHTGATDLIPRDPSSGFLLNAHDPDNRIAAVVHQVETNFMRPLM